MVDTTKKLFKLLGKVQHYSWGGRTFLPKLLRLNNPDNEPFAEYWLGAHDKASAELIIAEGEKTKLNEYIRSNATATLGEFASRKFDRLPYLLKILDVRDMLSIQVHPSKKNAENEFLEENNKRIPLHAPERNYKDDNHKPELMLALGDFWLLHGFKSGDKLKSILSRIPELNFLVPVFNNGGYYALYRTVMELDQDVVNEILQPLIDRIIPPYEDGRLQKPDENFWAARAALTYNEPGKIDRGIFSIYLFNLVNLKKDQAIFQEAGLPHAYLEGQNVEIMANSDNVLRGGLTSKHIDVHELLKHIEFSETIPQVILGTGAEGSPVHLFISPAPDFELASILMDKETKLIQRPGSAEIFIVFEGEIEVEEKDQAPILLKSGEAFIAFSGVSIQISANQNSKIYRAGVPLLQC
jgi:mannose-6-phosphate isomerase